MTTFPKSLIKGYGEFKTGRYASEEARYRKLAEEGQTPECMVISCCDSRAAPETIFNSAPGEIFVVRNVANLVPPYEPDGQYHSTSAAIEFAVQGLKVKHIVILGHGRCGGIKAALDPNAEPLSSGDFIGKWMDLLGPAAETVSADSTLSSEKRQTALERLAIRHSIGNLRTFPFIAKREAGGELQLHGAWFDISGGDLLMLEPETGDYKPAPQDT